MYSESSDGGIRAPAEVQEDSAGGEGFAGDGSTTVDREEALVTTGSIAILVEDPIAAAGEAIRIVEGAGGRIDAREEYAATEYNAGEATLVLRIPAKAHTATLAKVRELGDVQNVQISSENVTAEVADLEGRISALEASVERLTGLLATASNTENLVTIESSLSSRQAELESLKSQQRALGDQVAMSTVTLRLVSEPLPAEEDEPSTFFTGLTAGWESFVGFILGLTVVFGALLPWLVFLGILGAAALATYRWRRAKKSRTVVD